MSEAAFSIPDEDRDITEVASLHGLYVREFLGKTILNLGSGSGNLQADLDAQGIEATVISIDINPESLGRAAESPSTNRLIRADAALLPLRDESVDIAIATYSLPLWSRSPDQLRQFFDECRRVVKIGGKLAIYPMDINVKEHYEDAEESETWHAMNFMLKVEADELSRSPDWHNLRRNKDALLYTRTRKTPRTPNPVL